MWMIGWRLLLFPTVHELKSPFLNILTTSFMQLLAPGVASGVECTKRMEKKTTKVNNFTLMGRCHPGADPLILLMSWRYNQLHTVGFDQFRGFSLARIKNSHFVYLISTAHALRNVGRCAAAAHASWQVTVFSAELVHVDQLYFMFFLSNVQTLAIVFPWLEIVHPTVSGFFKP